MEDQPKIDLIENSPVALLLAKIQEVLGACATLKSRVDIMEDHLVFLLSNSPQYLELMNKKNQAEAVKQEKASDEENATTKSIH